MTITEISKPAPGALPPATPIATTVRLSGEIDIFSSPAMRERLLEALRHSRSRLVVDLSGVSFCDVSGLAVLMGVQRRARAKGVSFAVTGPRPYLSRLLLITGLDRSLRTVA